MQHGNEILIVENNTVDGMFIAKTLRDSNNWATIKIFDTCEKALDYLNGAGVLTERVVEIPRLVILDLSHRGMSGFQFLAAVRTNTALRHLPIVVFTDSKAEHDRTLATDLGANGFFAKSVDLDSFLGSIHEIGNTWLKEPVTQ